MEINFDLISDFNIDDSSGFKWENKATSPYCIVAGNISKDRIVLCDVLEEISKYYEKIFFIDGVLEHFYYLDDIPNSYMTLEASLGRIENLVFMHENIIIMNEVSILATNGWTTFDFTRQGSLEENIAVLSNEKILTELECIKIYTSAKSDFHYMRNSLEICQKLEDCGEILLVTSTMPIARFIEHDKEYQGKIFGDVLGNSDIINCLEVDDMHLVTTWLFGGYPGNVDYQVDGVRFASNPFEAGSDFDMYKPKKITLKQ